MVARRAPEAAQHRARRPSTPQGSATNRVVDRVSISPALLATASSRQDPPRVNSTPSRRARTHRTMASLAHSAALAAVGARPGAGRRATAGRASSAARSHRGDVRTTVRAVGGKTVRHSRDTARAPARTRALTLRLRKPSSASPRQRWGVTSGGATSIPRPPRAQSSARATPIPDPSGLPRSRRPLSPPSWACASPRRSPGANPPLTTETCDVTCRRKSATPAAKKRGRGSLFFLSPS